jgi:hypothetical protein
MNQFLETPPVTLRPSVINPSLWHPARPSQSEWARIRKHVLERDNYTCQACGHHATSYMNIHHLDDSGANSPDRLVTICVACHAVLHMGRNLALGVIEIWQCDLSQVEIVRRSREGIRQGLSLTQINASFGLRPGPHPPNSIVYANELVQEMDDVARAYLPVPLTAVFVNLSRWQLD